ncbi:hypothetical protein OQA88_6354 [Cercophora sp. LCS_1]
MTSPNIHLYTVGTPNGIKVSILLEELGLPYRVTELSFSKNEQKEPWFLAINPNGRIPAITDTFTDGKPIRVFESGAILQYLADRYDTEHKLSYPKGSREDWEVNGYAPEKIPYGINRYQNETKRLYSVMEDQLATSTSGYLVGDRMTIADISCWGWVNSHDWAGVSIDGFPKLKEWLERMRARPGVAKGAKVPKKDAPAKKLTDEEIAEEARAWIMKGNESK